MTVIYRDEHVRVDFDRHEVQINGKVVHLTKTEWLLLCAFIASPGVLISEDRLARVRYAELDGSDTGLATTGRWHLANMRRKLGWSAEGPLVAVRGFGYKYDPKWKTNEGGNENGDNTTQAQNQRAQ